MAAHAAATTTPAFVCPRCTLRHAAPTPPALWRCTMCDAPRHPRLLVHAEDLPKLVRSESDRVKGCVFWFFLHLETFLDVNNETRLTPPSILNLLFGSTARRGSPLLECRSAGNC